MRRLATLRTTYKTYLFLSLEYQNRGRIKFYELLFSRPPMAGIADLLYRYDIRQGGSDLNKHLQRKPSEISTTIKGLN